MCEHLLAQVLGKAIELGGTELKVLKSPKISSFGRSRLPHVGTDFVRGVILTLDSASCTNSFR